MKKFTYRTFQDYEYELKSKKWSRRDIIDRTGYIPLDLQFDRMMAAGIDYSRVIDSQYSEDWKDLEKLYENNELNVADKVKVRRYNDMTELDSILKEKMSKYKKALEDEKKLTNLHDKYLKGLENEKMRQDIINDYVEKQKNLQKTE